MVLLKTFYKKYVPTKKGLWRLFELKKHSNGKTFFFDLLDSFLSSGKRKIFDLLEHNNNKEKKER